MRSASFVSFDVEHDKELYDRLREQSSTPGSSFTMSGRSERFSATDAWNQSVRRKIDDAEQVIVICGEHTNASMGVLTELRIAQETEKPYFLLWGRRGQMCTKPSGAKSTEGMYSWTLPILQDQIARIARTPKRADARKPAGQT